MNLIEAVARKEGFGVDPMNRPTRNNNPGNLQWGPHARSFGSERIEIIPRGYISKPRFAYFPTPEAGFAALRGWFEKHREKTLIDAMHIYAPPSENDTEDYIDFICDKVGCSPHVSIDELLLAMEK